jgi:hypothetical protein
MAVRVTRGCSLNVFKVFHDIYVIEVLVNTVVRVDTTRFIRATCYVKKNNNKELFH